MRVRRGCGVTADLPKHAVELPSSSKLLSNYRRPAGKKKVRAEKAKRAARARWSKPEELAATAAAAAAGDDRTVRWGKLCTLGAIASARHAVEHLLAVGVLKAAPHAGSRRLRAVAAAVLAAELGGPEHGRLGAAALSKLAHGFARCVALRAAPPRPAPPPARPSARAACSPAHLTVGPGGRPAGLGLGLGGAAAGLGLGLCEGAFYLAGHAAWHCGRVLPRTDTY